MFIYLYIYVFINIYIYIYIYIYIVEHTVSTVTKRNAHEHISTSNVMPFKSPFNCLW